MPRCIISHAIPDCVTMYDGTQLPLACKVTIPVEFGDVVADTEFLVTVSDCENLLGVSFMREHCQNLDFAQGMLTFNNGTCIPVRYSRRELQNCRVYTSEKCTLPPRSSALLAVRLDDGHPENRGSPSIVELVKSRLHPSCNALEAAPALMTMPEGRGYIEVVNTADSEVFLQAGIRVGVATPLRTADLMYLSETPEPEVRHLPKNSEESSTAWLDEVEINSELSKEQHQRVRDLLVECQAAFSKHSLDAGLTHLVTHEIILKDRTPVALPPRRIPPHLKDKLDALLDEMLAKHIIRPAYSSYNSPMLIVPKKDGNIRLVHDFRALNDRCVYHPYPLPHIQETFAKLRGAQWYSSLDLAQGFWQIPLRDCDQHLTAFSVIDRGQFCFNVLPMGLHDSPGSFQRCINKLLDGLTPKTALGYMDDIVVHSVTFEEQLDNLRTVLQRIIAANLKVKPKKCHLFLKELHYLGHVVTPDGLKTCEDKIAQIRDWPVPQSVTQLRQFLGLANYYHKFVDGYAGVAAPLHALTRKDIGSLRQHWTPEHQVAFDTLKKKLCSTEVLALPEFNSDPAVKFVLDTDASDIRIGACLGQLQSDGVERPIAFFSRKLRDPEKRYTVTKKELLAIVDAMRHFRHYLIGKKFEVRSDHRALLWLLNQTQATGILGRWIERLSEFRFQLNHRKGKDHANADALSRRPEAPPIS
ncbi:hypothetical protein BOX15_Mlig030307g2, partial [Macrostomum lignano]